MRAAVDIEVKFKLESGGYAQQVSKKLDAMGWEDSREDAEPNEIIIRIDSTDVQTNQLAALAFDFKRATE